MNVYGSLQYRGLTRKTWAAAVASRLRPFVSHETSEQVQITPSSRIKFLAPRISTLNGRTVQLANKQAAPEYRSPHHAAWAKAIIARAGNRCEHCGKDNTRLFADHIHEIKDGGLLYDPMNGQALCGSCHTIKSIKARTERFLKDSEWKRS